MIWMREQKRVVFPSLINYRSRLNDFVRLSGKAVYPTQAKSTEVGSGHRDCNIKTWAAAGNAACDSWGWETDMDGAQFNWPRILSTRPYGVIFQKTIFFIFLCYLSTTFHFQRLHTRWKNREYEHQYSVSEYLKILCKWIIFVLFLYLAVLNRMLIAFGRVHQLRQDFEVHQLIELRVQHNLYRHPYEEKEILCMSEYPTGVRIPEACRKYEVILWRQTSLRRCRNLVPVVNTGSFFLQLLFQKILKYLARYAPKCARVL
jgi:hypothetical protein